MARGNKSIFSHALIAATLLAGSFAARAEMTYTITSYPAGLAEILARIEPVRHEKHDGGSRNSAVAQSCCET